MKALVVSVIAAITLSACTWVKLTSGGEKVSVLVQVPHSCEKIGVTTSRVKDDLVIMDRNRAKVIDELTILARNTAADMNGNAVRSISDIEYGKMTFEVYRCQ